LNLLIICTFLTSSVSARQIYTTVPIVNVREKPDINSRKIGQLQHGIWVERFEQKGEWTRVKLQNAKDGFIFTKLISSIWIKIWKDERLCFLMDDRKILKKFPIALGFNPKDDKRKEGDGCTPNGRFYICEYLKNPQPRESYGARSLRISYPDIEDARRGLKEKSISKSQYFEIVQAISKGEMPPQNTILGSSIRIHGGGVGEDWTLGCMALNDEDIRKVYSKIPDKLAIVEIYQNEKQDKEINDSAFSQSRIIQACMELTRQGCSYTNKAVEYQTLSYPEGDIDSSIGVCSDLIVRALRKAGIDLQASLHEDIHNFPKDYPMVKKADKNIDHRRVKSLKPFFDKYCLTLTNRNPDQKPEEWKPGDIVLFDTGVQNGTIYDHIGIVGNKRENGKYWVCNLWTIGFDLQEMDLLYADYPDIVGHYRLIHPLCYDGFKME
jgi:uncharacterized protein YijF (DUF1287 family)